MLDSLLKSKFYTKCKSEVKMTLKRIEMIKRKRNAMQKFLRNDVADLLKTGLESNAYGRVEQLYADVNLSSCYEFIEQWCLFILSNLSAMNKQRECPDECKEAISTLMFAAARFADLPELRELRGLFVDRYGNCLDPYVNQEFVRNLKADPPCKEIKLQMIQEIAVDYKIKWDSKALEVKLYKPPPSVQDWSPYSNGRNNTSPKTHHQNGLERNIQETKLKNGTDFLKKDHRLEDKNAVEKIEEKQVVPPIRNSFPNKPRAEVEKKEHRHPEPAVGNSLLYNSRAAVATKKEEKHDHGRVSPYWSRNTSYSSESTTSPEYSTGPDDSALEDVSEGRKDYAFRSMASPNIETESAKKATISTISGSGREDLQSDIPEGRKYYGLRSMGPPYIKTDLSKKPLCSAEEKISGLEFKERNSIREEESESISKPVPRSVRNRRPFNPVAGSSQVNSEIPKPGTRLLKGENLDHDHIDDDLERKMDKFLSHCSKKPSQIPAPTRSGSLPLEPLNTSVAAEGRKGLSRATTYQADSALKSQGHVHPKLPDYDEFVARLAALRANS
uniref:uncharacterized protein LOC122589335 n=1 Tax=Erigeron canadensis TaxID=72917 RepID=UPI001CB97E24|nr:uncharacterized protein LOC122589335 [Erigeron canadensis]